MAAAAAAKVAEVREITRIERIGAHRYISDIYFNLIIMIINTNTAATSEAWDWMTVWTRGM